MKDKTIVVWFSCGAASAIALKRTIDKYGADNTIRAVNNPVAEEDPDNKRFLKDVSDWLSIKVESAINPKWPNCSAVEVWEKRSYMAGINGAPCTTELKKKARQHWESQNTWDYLVLGFTVEEKTRHSNFVLTERENLLPVLIEDGLTKKDCLDILLDAGIQPPAMYSRGYPNANCIGCVKATSPTYWNLVRRDRPDIFAKRAEQSKRIGARLVRVDDERIFLDDLDPKATGNKIQSFECGSFCEERQPSLFYGVSAEASA